MGYENTSTGCSAINPCDDGTANCSVLASCTYISPGIARFVHVLILCVACESVCIHAFSIANWALVWSIAHIYSVCKNISVNNEI